MSGLGVPAFLESGCLPTKSSIYNHYLRIREDDVKEGRWKVNSPISEICKTVSDDVWAQWEKTTIPTLFSSNPKQASKIISYLITEARSLLETPLSHKKEVFGSEQKVLLDMVVCKHSYLEFCNCKASEKVPKPWFSFLQDQWGPRLQGSKLTKHSLSLRTADNLTLTEDEKVAIDSERKREERQSKYVEQEKRAKERDERANEVLKRKHSVAKDINEEEKK